MSSSQPFFNDSDPSFDDRRKRMLERLNARRQQAPTGDKSSSQLETQSTNFDAIQSKAKTLMDSGETKIDPSFISEIEAALALLPPGLQSRRLREAYNELRSRVRQERTGDRNKPAFSFSSKAVPKSNPTTVPVQVKEEVATSNDESARATPAARGKDSISVSDKVGESIRIAGEDGKEVTVMNVSDCLIEVPFHASAVHLKGVRRCTLVFVPVGSSILIRDCEALTLAAVAQQIRIHGCRELKLHVAVRGAVIIEDCQEVSVAPYKVRGVDVEWTNDNWKDVKDFNWLVVDEKSPNWRVLPEELWKEFEFGLK